ncbi:MAG TPA: Stp1/IreP family PP2C-type Ser/Thr phosphatase [Thermoanaerobaculia bacterium]|nr:Stp1/IreP family PP2C-type Ser/Thr phosphatase [Thermoanaerobaculia bacterium]
MSESTAANPAAPHSRLTVRAVLRTDVGKVRSENQDFGMVSTPAEVREGRLMVVADGMGGHRGGATASRMATETVKEQFQSTAMADPTEVLRKALSTANARIFAEAQANPELRGMGTTTSALVVRGGEGWFGHVGDSRIYLVRGTEIRQLTEDHSLVASMVREGLLTSAEAENHPRRNVLQRSMGVSEDVEIDVQGPLELQEGDTFIVCSDGLHGVVKEDEIRQVAALPIDDAADELVRRALGKGAPDNVTVIVARIEKENAFDPDATVVEKDDSALFEDTVVERDQAQGSAPKSFSIMKWTLIFVLVLAAAGGGIFWAQQQGFARQTQSTGR